MIKTYFESAGRFTLFCLETFYYTLQSIFSFSIKRKLVFAQLNEIGVNSLPIVLITGFFTGAVLVAQIGFQFKQFGAERFVGGVVALALARELGPILTAIVVTGRIGSAIAAELGSMKVTEQIDALSCLSAQPVKYLVVPRVISSMVMLPLLTLYTNFVGCIGGILSGVYQVRIDTNVFFKSILDLLSFQDIVGGMLKAVLFGAIIALVGCFKGFNTQKGAKGVGDSTTGSVVNSIMIILISNYFLSILLFNLSNSYIH